MYADDTILKVRSGIWSVATTLFGLWTWIWSVRHCRLGQKVACWFQCWKTQVLLFDPSTNTGAIDMKMGLFFRKSSFKIQGLNFSFKLDWASYIISIVKTATPKIGAFSFTCCLTWTLGSSLKCCQLKSFLYVLLW